jgi:hypothetical protein
MRSPEGSPAILFHFPQEQCPRHGSRDRLSDLTPALWLMKRLWPRLVLKGFEETTSLSSLSINDRFLFSSFFAVLCRISSRANASITLEGRLILGADPLVKGGLDFLRLSSSYVILQDFPSLTELCLFLQ